MPFLTDEENEKIKTAMMSLDLNEQPYEYDKKWGKTYTQKIVIEIFDNCGLTLTDDDMLILGKEEKLTITKASIFQFGETYLKRDHAESKHLLKFSLLCLLWGYASQNYREYRIKKILAPSGAVEKLTNNTKATFELIKAQDIQKIYQQWHGAQKIANLGEAFFTKIIFFLSKHCGDNYILSIKDNFTSKAAAFLFDMPDLHRRSKRSFSRYIAALKYASSVSGYKIELIEQYLFTIRIPTSK